MRYKGFCNGFEYVGKREVLEQSQETYTEYSAEDLLVIISMADDEPEEAKNAFIELVNRYREKLTKYCAVKCAANGKDPGEAPDLVWNTFYKIKKNPNGFDMKEANTEDTEEAVLAYLKGIAKNEYYDRFFPKKKPKQVNYDFKVDTSKTGEELYTRKVLRNINEEVILALSRLNWKQREVFLAYFEFAPNGEYLPREIGDQLREALQLAGESSLRVYHLRAKEQLQKLLNSTS